jgi:hypothetical protein
MIYININLFKVNEEELWRPVVRFPGYEVSDKGRVRSFKSGKAKILKLGKDGSGYPIVCLYKNGRGYWFLVHRLVAEAFLGFPEDMLEVNHKNGVKTDNRVENLEWLTRSDNHKHAIKTGLRKTKLSENQVLEILDMLDAGVPQTEIAEIFNIAQSTVSMIKSGRRWSHLTGRSPEKPRLKNPGKNTLITINLNFWLSREAI